MSARCEARVSNLQSFCRVLLLYLRALSLAVPLYLRNTGEWPQHASTVVFGLSSEPMWTYMLF